MSLTKRVKFVFAYLLFATLAKGDSAPAFKVDEIQIFHPGDHFPTRGKFAYIRVRETKSSQSSHFLSYMNNNGTESYCVTRTLRGMNRMMASEFPGGISVDKAENILWEILLSKWGGDSSYIVYMSHLNETVAKFPGKERGLQLAKELFGAPVIEVNGNNWLVHAFTANTRNGISFRKFFGTLKPFMIVEYNETILLPDEDKESDELWSDDVLRMAIKKKHALLPRLLAEWKTTIEGSDDKTDGRKPNRDNPNNATKSTEPKPTK